MTNSRSKIDYNTSYRDAHERARSKGKRIENVNILTGVEVENTEIQQVSQIISEINSQLGVTLQLESARSRLIDDFVDMASSGETGILGPKVGYKKLIENGNQHLPSNAYNMVLVSRDISAPNMNYIYGAGIGNCAVISTIRTRHQQGDHYYPVALAATAGHEFGHLLGIYRRSWNCSEQDGHCNGENGACLMEQSDMPGRSGVIDGLMEVIKEGRWYCNDCRDVVRFKQNTIHHFYNTGHWIG